LAAAEKPKARRLGKSEAFSGLDGKVLPKATLSGLDVLERRLFGPA
jgi:hypothetical protein